MSSKRTARVWVISGNHSFLGFEVPIRIESPFKGAELVLENLVEFEEQRPNIRVTNWKPETHMVKVSALGSFPHCLGIWIDHEPKEPKLTSDYDYALDQD